MASTSLAFDVLARDNASKTFNKIADNSEKTGKRVGGAFSGMGKVVVGAFAGIAAVSVFKNFIAEAEESRKIGRLTAQVIKTTGGAAKVTAGQVEQLATAISNKTGIDDEAIQSASNLLLTFTGVRNEVGKGNDIFNQATQAAVDMSVVLGTDSKAAALQLGKALNNPTKGITALSRAGVSFTDQQKKQIKALQESGDTLGAQKIILAELSKEFGGAAEAASDPMQKLKTILGNLGEAIGTALLPAVDKVATFIADPLIPRLTQFFRVVREKLGPVVLWLGEKIVGLRNHFRGSGDGATSFKDRLVVVAQFVHDRLLPAIRAVADYLVVKFTPTFRALRDYLVNSVIPAYQGLAQRIRDNIGPISQVVVAFGKFAATVASVVLPVAIKLAGFMGSTMFAAVGKVIGIVGGLARAFIWVGTKLGETAYTITQKFTQIVGFVQGMPAKISSAASGMWDGIKNSFRGALNWIIDKWNNLSFTIGGGSIFGKDLPSTTLGTPNIPRLAEGGIVRARPGGIVANIGEGRYDEAVVPLNGRHGLGGGLTVQVIVQGSVVSERDLIRKVRDGLADFMRQNGADPALIGA